MHEKTADMMIQKYEKALSVRREFEELYDEIFDYSFDSEINPVKRWMGVYRQLVKLHTLPADDWIDILFEIKDKIDYNADHYKSDDFMREVINYLKNQQKWVY